MIAYADDMILFFFTGTDLDKVIPTADNVLGALKNWNDLNCFAVNYSDKSYAFRARNKELNPTTHVIFSHIKMDLQK